MAVLEPKFSDGSAYGNILEEWADLVNPRTGDHSDSESSFNVTIPSFLLSDKGSCLNGNRNEMHRPVQNEEEW